MSKLKEDFYAKVADKFGRGRRTRMIEYAVSKIDAGVQVSVVTDRMSRLLIRSALKERCPDGNWSVLVSSNLLIAMPPSERGELIIDPEAIEQDSRFQHMYLLWTRFDNEESSK